MSETQINYSVGRYVNNFWTEITSDVDLESGRQFRDTLNRARASHNKLVIRKTTKTIEFVE